MTMAAIAASAPPATDSPDERYPWDRPEAFQPEVSVTLIIVPATPIEIFDHQPADTAYRVVGVRVGQISLHTGLDGGDAEIVEVIDRLIDPLHALRHAAMERLAETSPPAPTLAGSESEARLLDGNR